MHKRILFAQIFLCLLFANKLNAQIFSITNSLVCANASNSYSSLATMIAFVPSATDYGWVVIGPGNAVVNPTPGGVPHNSVVAISFPTCGIYQVSVTAFNNTVAPFTVTLTSTVKSVTIVCPNSGSVQVSQNIVCKGDPVTLTATGGTSYVWSNGSTTNPLVITSSVNSCYSYTATTASGCTITSPPGCFSVQAVNLAVSPASQTICAGAPICLTTTGTAVNNSSVTPGTVTTGIQWYAPGGGTVSSCTTAAVAGNYTAVLTHTGAAGTCTYAAVASVATSTNISVTASANVPSVCPSASVQLTATSVQTIASTYTWTSPPNVTSVGNPIVRNPSAVTVYTVDVDYFGCPGTATVQVDMLSLTPTLTATSPSACPNQSLTLTALPGNFATTHTFTALTPAPVTLANGVPPNTAVHTPTSLGLQYVVNSYSNGCTGSATITVGLLTLNPTLSLSSPSICPNTQFTLSSTGGAGTSYTFVAPYFISGTNNTITASNSNAVAHTPVSNTLSPIPNTYTVYVDSAGCTGNSQVATQLLTLNPTLTASSPSICAGTQLTLTSTGGAGTTYTFMNLPSTILGTGINNNVTHTPSGTLMTYSVSVDSAGCTGAATRTVGILNLGPQLTLTPSSASICPNTQFTLSAKGAVSYTFYAPPLPGTALSLISPTSAVHIPGALGAGLTYTVRADSSSCKGETTATIYEHKLNPIIAASSTLVCSGMSVNISASGVNPTGPNATTSYTFYAGLTPITPGTNPFNFVVHNPTVNTTYAVKVDSANCTGLVPFPTVSVQIRPALVLAPFSSAASVCPGTAATISVPGPTNSGAASNYTWTWIQTTGTGSLFPAAPYPLASSSTTAVVHPLTNSTYSVNVLDSLGCVGSTAIVVSIDPAATLPVIVSSNIGTICAQQSATLSATSTISTIGTITYTWHPVTPPIAINPVAVSPTVTTIYTVVAHNGFGCYGTNTLQLVVGQLPILTTPPNYTAVCPGFASTVTAFGANTYTWTGSSFTGAIVQQSISAGPGSYTVLGSNGGGCTATAVQIIQTLPPLAIKATASSPTTCIANNMPKFSHAVTLKASGASNYVWFPNDPNIITCSICPQTYVRPVANTCFTVVGSTPVCAGQTVICVNVIPQFTMTVLPKQPAICLGDSLKLSIENITGAVGMPSAFTYSWSEPGNAPPISISNYLTPTVTVFPQNTSTYTVQVIDTRTCASIPRLVTVTVLPRPLTAVAIPTINGIPTNSLCYVGMNPGESMVTLNLIASNQNTNLQFGVVPTYTWISPYPEKYNPILSPVNNAGITIMAPLKLPQLVTYSVLSGYNGIKGCTETNTVEVQVVDCRPVKAVYFETAEKNDTICARTCITFINHTDTAAGGAQKYKWSFQGGSPPTSTDQNPTVCYNLPNSYNVILRVENPYPTINPAGQPGSSLEIGILNYITVVDVPNVTIFTPGQLANDTTIRMGQKVNLHASGAKKYEWSPNYNITSLVERNITVTPFKTTQYILTGYNSKSCFSSDTVNVIVIEDCGEMYVPNAFTPNGDGNNDKLFVRGICLQSISFMIFNRWGEKIFETSDQSLGWDGSYKGEELNTGVFVYRLEGKTYDGKGFSLKGNITLLR